MIHLLPTHADRQVVDISVTLCFYPRDASDARVIAIIVCRSVCKVKYASICIARFTSNRLKCAQTCITQFYLQIHHACLYSPAAEHHRPFGWYSFTVPRRVKGWVDLCVCLSHAGIVSKRINVGWRKQRHVIAQGLVWKGSGSLWAQISGKGVVHQRLFVSEN